MNEVTINLNKELELKGILATPSKAKMIVVFAHGSGSGRFSPRNQYVADFLKKKGLGYLLLDLLTPHEEAVDEGTREYRFNIPLLAERLMGVARWLKNNPATASLLLGFFGSSTGAAAALIAAADLDTQIAAVVSRGGRPDLASTALPKVRAPTLFIVGGNDFGVIELNQQAFNLLNCEKQFAIIPGATHLFEEPGKLQEVARFAADWFLKSTT